MSKQAVGILGLAHRSRNTATGDGVIRSIQKKRARLIVIADDCGDNMRKKLIDKCTFYQVEYCFMEAAQINQAMGTENRKSVAILDEGFAQKLHTCLKG